MEQFKLKNFLDGKELSVHSLTQLLNLSEELRLERIKGITRDQYKGKTLALLFDKPSLRTRTSFSVAMVELGGNVIEAPSEMRKAEDYIDVAEVMSRYVHAIMIRTHAHEMLEKFAKSSKVPVINGLTNEHHPCQALADILTLKQKFQTLEQLKLAYIGDGNNVLHSLMMLAPMLGIDVHYSCPSNYQPDGKLVEWCQTQRLTKGKIKSFKTPQEAVEKVDAIYTDVWTSMGFEEENSIRLKAFQGYQVNSSLHALANPNAIILHCMPMVREQEITSEMVNHKNSAIYQQAENRLHTEKALLLSLLG